MIQRQKRWMSKQWKRSHSKNVGGAESVEESKAILSDRSKKGHFSFEDGKLFARVSKQEPPFPYVTKGFERHSSYWLVAKKLCMSIQHSDVVLKTFLKHFRTEFLQILPFLLEVEKAKRREISRSKNWRPADKTEWYTFIWSGVQIFSCMCGTRRQLPVLSLHTRNSAIWGVQMSVKGSVSSKLERLQLGQ